MVFVARSNLLHRRLKPPLRKPQNPQCGFPLSWRRNVRSLPGDLKTRFARLARYARLARNIPGTQAEAARPLDEILTPIAIESQSAIRLIHLQFFLMAGLVDD